VKNGRLPRQARGKHVPENYNNNGPFPEQVSSSMQGNPVKLTDAEAGELIGAEICLCERAS
jgi:hypothetical protein